MDANSGVSRSPIPLYGSRSRSHTDDDPMLKSTHTEPLLDLMSLLSPDLPIPDDTRGVSEVIGFVFIFGILIILLSINQAQIVPQENAEIEFEHFQDVRNDLVEVRSSISTAGQADVSQFPTVTLGTNYPPRIFAVNPTTPIGTLQTSEKYNITITNQTADPSTGETTNVSTRFLEYQPRYNEIDIESTWYENSILYLDNRDQGGIAIIEDQNLVTDRNVTRITALQNDFQKSGTERVTLELYPVQTTSADEIPSGNVTVTLPTRLSGNQYWNDELKSKTVYLGVENDSYDDGIHALNLNINTSNQSQELQFNTVGIKSEPSGGAKQSVGTGSNTNSPTATPTPTPSNSPPTAGFTVTSNGPSANDKYDLNADTSNDSDGTIIKYEWEWISASNGERQTDSGETVTGAKIESGTDVTLTVTDNDGATDTETKTVPT